MLNLGTWSTRVILFVKVGLQQSQIVAGSKSGKDASASLLTLLSEIVTSAQIKVSSAGSQFDKSTKLMHP